MPPRCTVKRSLWFPMPIYFCPTFASWSDHIRFLWLFFHITPQQQQTSDMFSSQDHYVSLSSSHLNSSLAQSLAVSFANFYDFWSLSLFPCVYTLHVYRYTSTNRTHLIVTNFKQKRSHWTIRSLKFDFLFLSLPTRLIDRTNNRNNRLSAIAQTKTCLFSTYFSCVAAVVLIFCVILAIAEAKDWERSSASRESGPNAGRLQADHLGSESAGQEQIGTDQKSI